MVNPIASTQLQCSKGTTLPPSSGYKNTRAFLTSLGIRLKGQSRAEGSLKGPAWRIIPVSKWLGSPPFISHLGHLEGEQPYLGDFLTMILTIY